MFNLSEAYYDYIKSDVYGNYIRNKKLTSGMSTDVFYQDVLTRVKLEYMGVLNQDNYFAEFSRSGNSIVKNLKPFRTLIVPHGILSAVTKVYAELGSNAKPIVSLENENDKAMKLFNKLDLKEKLEEILEAQSSHGKCLLKCNIVDSEIEIDILEPNQYFKVAKGFAVFNRYDKKIAFEIYHADKVEYRLYKEVAGTLEEIEYFEDLTKYGGVKDGLGYSIKTFSMQVVEVKNLFNRSDYTEDLIKINRELVIGETLTSQAFDKVANPLLQLPEGAMEYNEKGELTVKLQDRVVVVDQDDKEVKQVQLETKTSEWDIHRKNLIEQVYQQTGTNEQVFGLNKNGSSTSGEAKKRDMERVISTVLSKRDKALVGLEKILKWGFRKIYNEEIEVKLIGQDVLSLSFGEKVDIVTKGIQAGVMSSETAIKFLNISNVNYDTEIEKIKKEAIHLKPLVENLVSLSNLTSDMRLADAVKKMTDDLIEELEL